MRRPGHARSPDCSAPAGRPGFGVGLIFPSFSVFRSAAALLCTIAAAAALAQGFPSKPVRVLVPYAPGGAPDTLARVTGLSLAEGIGQQVIVENRPGAGGVVAAEVLMRSPPDGHTLMVADSSIYSVNPNLNTKLPFEPLRDFAPVSLASNSWLFLVVNASLPVQNVREFIELARARPGMNYGSSGNGTSHHLAMELVKTITGVELTHVPYKGTGQSVPALLAGEVPVMFAAINTILPHARAGKLRILAVATAARSPLQPQIPTLEEAGVPGCVLQTSFGFLAAANTPRELLNRLSSEINKALAVPEVRQRLASAGLHAVGSTPEQFAELIREELQRFGKLVRAAGMSVN